MESETSRLPPEGLQATVRAAQAVLEEDLVAMAPGRRAPPRRASQTLLALADQPARTAAAQAEMEAAQIQHPPDPLAPRAVPPESLALAPSQPLVEHPQATMALPQHRRWHHHSQLLYELPLHRT